MNVRMIEIDKEDRDKIEWCKNFCCGCDYCSGFRVDGSKCEKSPSDLAISLMLERMI